EDARGRLPSVGINSPACIAKFNPRFHGMLTDCLTKARSLKTLILLNKQN
ncbi:hypothetical protein QZH41_019487, partial [Actinostola sp. cb2023]